MTDKVKKIKDWISKEQDGLMDAQGNFEFPEHEGAYHILCNLDAYIDSLQEEPVSRTPVDIEAAMQEVEEKSRAFTEAHQGEDADTILAQMRGEEPVSEELEDAVNAYIGYAPEVDESSSVYGKRQAFKAGAKWQIENLWKSADGEDLPVFDREVIALLNNGKVVYAHRPNPDGWDGKSITTGEVKDYDVQTYDKGGWNIPDVKFWLDCELPKMEE